MAATEFCDLHPEIIKSHVLTRLDGPTLGAAACCSTTIRHLTSDQNLWSNICHSTWPSTTTNPRLSDFIATLGPRSFFSHAYAHPMPSSSSSKLVPPRELICAVDIYYKKKLIFSKTQETETVSGWFRCSPFRIDLVQPKDVVPTPIKHDTTEMMNDMTLSWILIDVIGRSVVNLSSHNPVTVHRHWLTGELQVRYASILAADVHCDILVTCAGSDAAGEMHVKEVCLQMEDMDGMHLNGKDSLVFLQGALEAKNRTGKNRVQHARRRYREYVEMKKERRERKLRTEGVLDTFCVAFGVSIFLAFCFFMLWR